MGNDERARLRYMSIREGAGRTVLVIQLEGGGVADIFELGMPSEMVAVRLRHLADRLEDQGRKLAEGE